LLARHRIIAVRRKTGSTWFHMESPLLAIGQAHVMHSARSFCVDGVKALTAELGRVAGRPVLPMVFRFFPTDSDNRAFQTYLAEHLCNVDSTWSSTPCLWWIRGWRFWFRLKNVFFSSVFQFDLPLLSMGWRNGDIPRMAMANGSPWYDYLADFFLCHSQ
jgi:hypothetical protein